MATKRGTGYIGIYRRLQEVTSNVLPTGGLIEIFNDLHDCNLLLNVEGMSVVKNTCPSLLQPLRKLTITKLLQVIAQHRASYCAQLFLDIIVDIYHGRNTQMVDDSPRPVDDDNAMASSDNSSIEVYKALTRYMTPPQGGGGAGADSQPHLSDVPVLDSMLGREDLRLAPLLGTMSITTPQLLGPYAVKHTKSGHVKIRAKVRLKICDYYRQVLWGEVGTYLEHILLWWGNAPLGPLLPHLPDLMRPALLSLRDSLCCHVTSTSWDLMFRRSLVAAAHQNSRHPVNNCGQGTWTGELFREVFSSLVSLSNSCEGSNWTLEDLEQLPLVEQIPILHRLDHSVHTARNWAASRARQLANHWNIDQFFRVTQSDVNSSLQALMELRTSSQVELLSVESSVHVTVCCKMRGKLVSEVKTNISKLQKVPTECVAVLATVCRTFCLANLRMIYPPPQYWKQQVDEVPQYATNYVEDYLEVVMRPVLLASSPFSVQVQQHVGGLVLHIMCEAWLDHITTHRIKFSEWGALQLLTDFGAVPTWLLERVTLLAEVRKPLLNNDILRRCEGVGRLLLHEEADDAAASQSPAELMPPEMYVPNQELWLQLRAPRPAKPFALCCGNT
ncbi:hypothetical protein LSTR_LSTR007857 [Laodelphax striatellus]|uniref:Coiled-coil protein 142 C-terminal domain-containing protein n=1 Tax=Laodelphax striatellus TaxID=195883 RepID=A0A482WNI4_LAOST|nr:hypothetical protein LSTR_LSTR007857 [Laodelphax striatellus]